MSDETKENEDVVGQEVPLQFVGDDSEQDVIEVPEDFVAPDGVEVEEEEEEKQAEEQTAEQTQEETKPAVEDVLARQFEELNKNLRAIGKPEKELPEKRTGESDEEFWKRVGEDIFDGEKMPKALTEVVQRVTSPVMAKLATSQMEDKKTILRLAPETKPVFERYGDEIEEEIKKLTRTYGPDPNIPKVALEEVKKRHSEEIVADQVERRVNELVEKKLKELGLAEGGGQQAKAKEFVAAGSGAMAARSAGPKKKRVRITAEVRKQAAMRGLTPEQYLGIV